MTASRTPGLVLIALAAVLVAFAAAGICGGVSQLTSRDGEAQAAESAARAFVLALGTFDYRAPHEYTTNLAPLTTGPLRSAIAGASVDPGASSAQRTMTARVESASVTSRAGDRATVAVTATQVRRWIDPSLAYPLHESVTQLVLCQLVREDGRWVVTGLEPQAIAGQRPEGR